MLSYPTSNRKLQKNSKKKLKKIENTITASFQDKIRWQSPRNREKKKYRSDVFLADL